MTGTIIASIITGVLALAGVIITNVAGNNKMQNSLDKQQAVTDTKIDELTREVREHNNFARRMPVIEEKIESLDKRITNIENKQRE